MIATRRPVAARRRSRLGLPPVNQDPQPPNAEKRSGTVTSMDSSFSALTGDVGGGAGGTGHGGIGGGGPNHPGGGHLPQHDGQGGGGQGVNPNDQHNRRAARRNVYNRLMRRERKQTNQIIKPVTSTAPIQELNQAGVEAQINALGNNPANALAFSSFSPGEGQVDPRDSKYWSNVNNLLFNTQSQYQGLQSDASRAATDQQTGLSDMATNRAREQRGLAEQAMRSGLSSSGWRDRTDAEDTTDFLRNYEDFQTSNDRNNADRRAAMSRVIQEFIGGERDLATDAVSAYDERQRQAAEDAPPAYDKRDLKAINKILDRRGRKGKK